MVKKVLLTHSNRILTFVAVVWELEGNISGLSVIGEWGGDRLVGDDGPEIERKQQIKII